MTRATSIAAFKYLVDGEHLARAQRGVYAALYEFGPLSSSELRAAVSGDDAWQVDEYAFVGKMEQCNITKRLSELLKFGLVKEVCTRACAITKREVIVWDVTDLERPLIVEKTRRGPRVSKDEISAAVEEIEGFTQNEPISPTLSKVLIWLRWRAE